MLYALSLKLAARSSAFPFESQHESAEFFSSRLFLWTDTWVCSYCLGVAYMLWRQTLKAEVIKSIALRPVV
jgi:hypothetical protein